MICHVSRMSDMNEWNEISRQIYNYSDGYHIHSNISDLKQPKADIYMLDCIINGAKEFVNFQKPEGSKVISIVHSTGRCFPAACSDRIITLTEADQKRMLTARVQSKVIPCAIDMKYYNNPIDYSRKTYGRITRYSNGKVHPNFNNVVNTVKSIYPDSECILITKPGDRSPNIRYIEDVKSGDNERKAKELSGMTIYADYHNTFIETFSLGLLEAMASGLCIVLYSIAPQKAMEEVLGGCGIVCRSEKEFLETIIKLLPDAPAKKSWGMKAKERARHFSIDRMIGEYNKIYQELLS